jgi:phosphatidate cytidylyltransferase
MANNLAQRIAVSAVAIPAAVGLIWLGGWPLAVALAALGVLGAREVYDLARRQGIDALDRTGWLAAAAIPLLAYWAKGSETHWAEPALYLGALWVMTTLIVAMVRRGPSGRPLAVVSVTLFGSLYASALLAFLIPIRHGSNAAHHSFAYLCLTLFPLAITWIGDTAAMAVGIKVGGAKLAPLLSPNKTRSGAVGGLLGAVITALALGLLVLNRVGWNFAVWQLATVGVVIGVVGRLDSLYFVVPAAAGLFKLYGVI